MSISRLMNKNAMVVSSVTWVTYADGTREPIRIATLDVRLLVTGSGNDDEFRTLATATTSGDVLP